MTESSGFKTTYYHLNGRFTKEVDGEEIPCDANEMEALIDYMLHALRMYEREGFRFVDVDANATLSTGQMSINWSDYGIQGILDERASKLALMRMQAFDAHERNP